MMRSEGVAPTEITYNVVLRLCGLGGCWAMGLELLGMMEVWRSMPSMCVCFALVGGDDGSWWWRVVAEAMAVMVVLMGRLVR